MSCDSFCITQGPDRLQMAHPNWGIEAGLTIYQGDGQGSGGLTRVNVGPQDQPEW